MNTLRPISGGRLRPRRLVSLVALSAALGASSVAVAAPSYGTLRATAAAPPGAKYVAPNGNDRSDGSRARPWRTIQRAVQDARPGQTILLRRGVYDERVSVNRSGAHRAPITIRSAPRERATVRGSFTIRSNWVQIAGITMTAGSTSRSSDPLVYVSGGDHVEITGNDLSQSRMSAIFLGDPRDAAHDVRIRGNRIHGNGSNTRLHHGIYCAHARDVAIVNNIVELNAAFGIQAYPDCDGVAIANNTIVGNGKAGIVVGGEGGAATDNATVANNVVVGNREEGIRSYWSSQTGHGNRLVRNLVSGNRGGGIDIRGITASGTITTSPRFVDMARRRYGLRPGSPAIGTAFVPLSPGYDIRNAVRGKRVDLGAIEAVPRR